MLAYFLPMAVVVISNSIYQICAKSTPSDINPFASLTVTYAVSLAASAVLFYVLNRNGSLLAEYRHLNWSPALLGLAVVGLESGLIFAYKVGWPISSASITECASAAVVFLIVGAVAYHEVITVQKAIGLAACVVGLILLNR